MLHNLSLGVLLFGLLEFGYRRTLSFLRYFQQEEYSSSRFLAWIKEKRAIDTRGTAILALAGLLSLILPGGWTTLVIAALATLGLSIVVRIAEEDPRRSGKLKLNMTQRASKIVLVSFGLFALLATGPVLLLLKCCGGGERDLAYFALWGICMAQAPGALLVVANKLLWPAEKALQDRFYGLLEATARPAQKPPSVTS
jgi:UDP-N-acetylmuramoyl-tripeptide--D-alanyl-D-alanine ligase